ncbi:MAG: putative lipid II flippase FtsW [Lachnospiraceae bacterium]|nr:putative lipid II flippase FtsW [Lachnospiraceae bacterium]MCR5474226.1 putative lipid II flippase FtsW [Lachnospiraceae bacterium]
MSEQRKKKKVKYFFDYTMLFIVVFLLLFGLVMLYSTSSYEANVKFEDPAFYFRKQAIASGIGIAVMLIIMLMDYHVVQKFALIAYAVSLVLILLVLTPLGYEAGGARRWLNLGMSLQPAEVAKLALIVFFASLVTKFGESIKEKKGFIIVLLLAFPHAICVLTITQNLSSAIIIFSIVLMMLFVATPQYKEYFIIAGIAIAVAVIVVLLVKYDYIPATMSYRLARIKAWLDPESYAANKGFQTLQALYAIGSGDYFGKGLGQSIQKLGYLPEAQNDMIFSIICEELGLFGAFAIILLFVLLIWRFMLIANNASDMFGALLVVGVMAHISIQVILNIAVVTNTIPNTGITLPFISYGGSSIVFLLAEMGLVLSVSRSIRVEG